MILSLLAELLYFLAVGLVLAVLAGRVFMSVTLAFPCKSCGHGSGKAIGELKAYRRAIQVQQLTAGVTIVIVFGLSIADARHMIVPLYKSDRHQVGRKDVSIYKAETNVAVENAVPIIPHADSRSSIGKDTEEEAIVYLRNDYCYDAIAEPPRMTLWMLVVGSSCYCLVGVIGKLLLTGHQRRDA